MRWFWPISLVTLAVTVYGQVIRHDFLNYDDDAYVTGNSRMAEGLSENNLRWALTTGDCANWHPLTWISLLADASVYGRWPGGYHLSSLALHAAGALFLYCSLAIMTGAMHRSGVVAAIYTVHPMHVQSVAWIAERKGILSSFFGLAAILAYALFAQRPSVRRYLVVTALFVASLMAKQMLVTMPALFLLLDDWPLRRWVSRYNQASPPIEPESIPFTEWKWLLWEKAPFVALAAVFSAIAFMAQNAGGAIPSLSTFPISVRLANAAISTITYARKAFWPAPLSITYPHSGGELPWSTTALCGLALLFMTVVACAARRQLPAVFVGWFWFLVGLAPVCGLVQISDHGMADRYTDIPLIGIYLAVVWVAGDALLSVGAPKWVQGLLASIIVCGLAMDSHWEASGYRDSETLFSRAVARVPKSAKAHHNLAMAVSKSGRHGEAIALLKKSIALDPSADGVWHNLGLNLAHHGDHAAAIDAFQRELSRRPNAAGTLSALGVELLHVDRVDDAIELFQQSLAVDPEYATAHNNLCVALIRKRQFDAAIEHGQRAVAIKPENPTFRGVLAQALTAAGRHDEVIALYREAARRDANDVQTREILRKLQSR